jgi:hypothetical protein
MDKIIKYIDCDGVILDTETGLFDNYNKMKQIDPTLKRLAYLQQLNWKEWIRQAKIINNSIEILKENNPYDAPILTKVHSLKEGLAKIEYFREIGLKNNIILVPNILKKSDVVQANGHLLVDDKIENVEEWDLSGGVPLFFNQAGKNDNTFKDNQIYADKIYPSIASLDTVFSKETDEYCKVMILNKHI